MLIRSALFACAAVAVAQPAFATPEPAQCDATNVRVYFNQGSTELDSAASELLNVAARQMASCGNYSELHVMVDGSSATSRARGNAVLAAMRAHDFDVARAESVMSHRVALRPSPDYVEVAMTPYPMPVSQLQSRDDEPQAGV